jgi:hypothetical protein
MTAALPHTCTQGPLCPDDSSYAETGAASGCVHDSCALILWGACTACEIDGLSGPAGPYDDPSGGIGADDLPRIEELLQGDPWQHKPHHHP